MFILDPDFIPASDNTILVKFGDGISENLHLQVLCFTQYLLKHPTTEITNINYYKKAKAFEFWAFLLERERRR